MGYGAAAMTLYNNRNALRRGIQNAARWGASFTQTQRRNQARSGVGVTTQHDRRNIYRKRFMPRYRKRRWRSFVKKVHAVAEKDFGTRTVVYNTTVTHSNTTSTGHLVGDFALYSLQSSTSHLNDLKRIAGYENSGDPTAADGINVDVTTKYRFQSAVLDMTIRNASTFTTSSVPSLDGRAKMELDVYEIGVRENFEDSDGAYGRLVEIIEKGQAAKTLDNAVTGVQLGDRGVTPWDLPYALSKYGIRIYKKTKYFIPNSDTITYQVRDPRRRVVTKGLINGEQGANLPKWTRWILTIGKLVPGLTIGTEDNTFQAVTVTGVTRKYMYKIEGANDDRDAYDIV